ncbi:MAG: hypothetical protein Q8920_11965 [Bacillota bacterium]|nr:hypothetical protein [Bacillota bacterium]
MNKKLLYKRAYTMLENATPLKFDCGLLCNSKCCSGNSDAGMILFPGEEAMSDKSSDFLRLTEENISDTGVLFAVCKGTCSRRHRPLSCRIFPYVPYLDGSGRLTIIEDPRAKYLCPLLLESFEFKIDKMFERKVFKAFRLLIHDNDIKSHISLMTGVLDEYKRFLL